MKRALMPLLACLLIWTGARAEYKSFTVVSDVNLFPAELKATTSGQLYIPFFDTLGVTPDTLDIFLPQKIKIQCTAVYMYLDSLSGATDSLISSWFPYPAQGIKGYSYGVGGDTLKDSLTILFTGASPVQAVEMIPIGWRLDGSSVIDSLVTNWIDEKLMVSYVDASETSTAQDMFQPVSGGMFRYIFRCPSSDSAKYIFVFHYRVL